MAEQACPARPAGDRLADGPTPKHAQLREILRRLAETELPPGSPIPSERELAARYGVSRLTVREAVGQLVADGLLARVRGKGTFTARARVEAQLYLESFTEDMRQRGMRPGTVVVERAERIPPPETAAALGLGPGEPAYWLVRVRTANGTPLAVERGWYHPGRLPELLEHDLSASLYALLADEYGARPDHGWQTVRADPADRATARLLGVRPGSPLLAFRRVSSAHGAPLEDMTSWYRGDLYQVTMQLDRSVPGSGPHPVHGGSR
ncbi:GntR family transcriptional regulator [Longimycelium tulufanense]|uniref:GntR family transcriptional regulator n=1 Tax=Longimycelium tulufanense TaxID=907463 RepID=A0A8J3CG15_9PSEU|nr:GntR family transcriptional regulator [Longimycelium tulufanense]GGM70196.1 GntR family transcriptional regulator [Longimycelium tulufanense]